MGQARRQPLDRPGGKINEIEVCQQHTLDIRLLHLDDNLIAVVQTGGVHLGNGRRG